MNMLWKFLGRPWGPCIAVVLTLIIFIPFDSHTVAILIGAGAASLFSPIMLAGILVVGLASKMWWQPLLAAPILAIAYRLLFTNPIGDQMPGWELLATVGSIMMCLVAIGALAGVKALLGRFAKSFRRPSEVP